METDFADYGDKLHGLLRWITRSIGTDCTVCLYGLHSLFLDRYGYADDTDLGGRTRSKRLRCDNSLDTDDADDTDSFFCCCYSASL